MPASTSWIFIALTFHIEHLELRIVAGVGHGNIGKSIDHGIGIETEDGRFAGWLDGNGRAIGIDGGCVLHAEPVVVGAGVMAGIAETIGMDA